MGMSAKQLRRRTPGKPIAAVPGSGLEARQRFLCSSTRSSASFSTSAGWFSVERMAADAQDDEQRDGSGGGHDPEHVRRFDGRKVRGRISLACRGAAGQDERLAGEAVLVHQRAVDSDADGWRHVDHEVADSDAPAAVILRARRGGAVVDRRVDGRPARHDERVEDSEDPEAGAHEQR